MTTTKVSIQFTSLTKLWAFRTAINVNVFEMNLSQLTITCECSKEHIQLAVDNYNARVVQTKEQMA